MPTWTALSEVDSQCVPFWNTETWSYYFLTVECLSFHCRFLDAQSKEKQNNTKRTKTRPHNIQGMHPSIYLLVSGDIFRYSPAQKKDSSGASNKLASELINIWII